MPLNIKDDRVHEEARQLAALTGESLTSAVGRAVSEKLSQLKRQKQQPGQVRNAETLLALARLCVENSATVSQSSDHALLYGEDGLPR